MVSDGWFFVTCRVLPRRGILSESEFACWARVIHERREEHGFLLCAGVFLPDHWHAIIYPPYPLTISTVRESLKGGATKRINRARRETESRRGIRRLTDTSALLFQPRFFDRALRTVREYHEKVWYIHLNPVKAGWVTRPEDWPWSSVHDCAGTIDQAPIPPSGRSTACRYRPTRTPAFDAIRNTFRNDPRGKEPQTNPSADGYVCATPLYFHSTFKGAATEPMRPPRSSRTTKRTVYSPGARSRAPGKAIIPFSRIADTFSEVRCVSTFWLRG